MRSVSINPSNEEHFLRLKDFCKRILEILKKAEIEPIVYGSLAYFYYSRDTSVPVNDIDMLIPEESFKRIMFSLKKNKIKYKYSAKWHVLQILENGLKIELDSIDFWQKDLPKKYVKVNFDGLILTCLSLDSLKKVYKKASEVSKDNPVGNLKKYQILKNLKDKIL